MFTKNNLVNLLEDLDACKESIQWVSNFEGTPRQAWEQCERGDWMLWLLDELDASRKLLVLSACGCARLSAHLNDDPRVLAAIEAAEGWVRGEVSLELLNDATWAAADAGRAAGRAAAWAAAWAAWAAARAAARAAVRAVADAARAAVRAATLNECAKITRKHFDFDYVFSLIEKRNITATFEE